MERCTAEAASYAVNSGTTRLKTHRFQYASLHPASISRLLRADTTPVVVQLTERHSAGARAITDNWATGYSRTVPDLSRLPLPTEGQEAGRGDREGGELPHAAPLVCDPSLGVGLRSLTFWSHQTGGPSFRG